MVEGEDERLDELDLPVTIGPEAAEEIAEKLENGERVNLWIDPETVPDLPDQIRWQLEEGQHVTELVDSYKDGDSE